MSKLKGLKKYLLGDGEGETNLNQFMKKKQNIVGVSVLVLLALSAFGLHSLSQKKEVKLPNTKESNVTSVDGVLSTDFTQKNELSALEQQQLQMDDLKKAFKALKSKQAQSKSSPSDQKAVMLKQVKAIIDRREKEILGKTANKVSLVQHTLEKPALTPHGMPISRPFSPSALKLETIQFHYVQKGPESTGNYGHARPRMDDYHEPSNYVKKTPKNYVPAGTFAKTVLLEGADANASVNAQSDTSGILVRVLDRGTLPNGHHSHLKGCFILASIYGDISSERGEARLSKMSCTRSDGSIFEKKVQGYLSFAGKEGIKGTPVMRNGKVLMMAGISGMFSGIGSALSQASQTQSISPLGATTTMNPNKVWQNGAYSGANSALSKMAGYYIKRADQYHPIIEIGSGTIATVIFQSGFSLLDEEKNQYQSNKDVYASKRSADESAKEMRRLLKQAQQLPGASELQVGSPISNVN